ncbi:TPA: hypothetical protein ACHVI3_000263 [Streptococcus suis]
MKKISLSDIFEPSNIRLALLDLSEKKDSAGLDGMYLSDLSDFLLLSSFSFSFITSLTRLA